MRDQQGKGLVVEKAGKAGKYLARHESTPWPQESNEDKDLHATTTRVLYILGATWRSVLSVLLWFRAGAGELGPRTLLLPLYMWSPPSDYNSPALSPVEYSAPPPPSPHVCQPGRVRPASYVSHYRRQGRPPTLTCTTTETPSVAVTQHRLLLRRAYLHLPSTGVS